jgi:prephenate dehydrogenase
MRITLLGLGLIGGSIARALRAGAEAGSEIVAWTPGGRGPAEALATGIIDAAAETPGSAIEGADLVVLAAPPIACIELLGMLGGELAGRLAPGATVTDVASTKGTLTRAARAAGVPFVGGHPMAGRETSGYAAGNDSLFLDRPWVVTEAVGGGDPEIVRRLARACGARVVDLGADEHDALVAAISHLPLLASVALVEAVAGAGTGAAPADWPGARALAATGWRDATRLARGDVAMGTDIAVTNAPALAARLHALRDRIDAWIAMLEAPDGPDPEAIATALAAAREHLEA